MEIDLRERKIFFLGGQYHPRHHKILRNISFMFIKIAGLYGCIVLRWPEEGRGIANNLLAISGHSVCVWLMKCAKKQILTNTSHHTYAKYSKRPVH